MASCHQTLKKEDYLTAIASQHNNEQLVGPTKLPVKIITLIQVFRIREFGPPVSGVRTFHQQAEKLRNT